MIGGAVVGEESRLKYRLYNLSYSLDIWCKTIVAPFHGRGDALLSMPTIAAVFLRERRRTIVYAKSKATRK